MPTSLRGADAATVRTAIESDDPLPGTAGFAGELDGALVRDVLGRQPLYVDAASRDWSFDPTALGEPELLDAGTVVDARTVAEGDRRVAWSLPTPDVESDHAAAVDAVSAAIETSIREPDPEGLAVAFSGGVDSALVAAGVPEAPCYVAGFAGAESHDEAAAREAAAAMGRDLRVVAFDHDDIVRAVPEIARATGRTNAMDVQISLPLYFAAEAAAADGYDRLAVGQGADELFGGYRKVVDPADDHRVDADSVRGATREVIRTLPTNSRGTC
ncbi:asparagine synthetase B [Halolamina pelagica]|uniref:Asparagine synthetase B n=1 Tax=Halolamina pelagica TaxID=699431 RepID=A0A0P7HW73_9EURY|nr:asparagine synthetase B [Halolamina pelagica]